MALTPAIDRATAARINPIISPVGSKDTLVGCADLVRTLGYVASETDPAITAHVFRLAQAVAAAVEFEAHRG